MLGDVSLFSEFGKCPPQSASPAPTHFPSVGAQPHQTPDDAVSADSECPTRLLDSQPARPQ
jgi:hypothetical protein